MRVLAGTCPGLLALHLAGCLDVGDDALASLASLRSLAELTLTGCHAVSDAGIVALAEGCGGYFRDNWNRLDFVIVVITILSSLSFLEVMKGLRSLRTLRALRPLRVVSRYPALQVRPHASAAPVRKLCPARAPRVRAAACVCAE